MSSGLAFRNPSSSKVMVVKLSHVFVGVKTWLSGLCARLRSPFQTILFNWYPCLVNGIGLGSLLRLVSHENK